MHIVAVSIFYGSTSIITCGKSGTDLVQGTQGEGVGWVVICGSYHRRRDWQHSDHVTLMLKQALEAAGPLMSICISLPRPHTLLTMVVLER